MVILRIDFLALGITFIIPGIRIVETVNCNVEDYRSIATGYFIKQDIFKRFNLIKALLKIA